MLSTNIHNILIILHPGQDVDEGYCALRVLLVELLCWQVTNLWGDADISVKDMILEAWNQTFDNMINM